MVRTVTEKLNDRTSRPKVERLNLDSYWDDNFSRDRRYVVGFPSYGTRSSAIAEGPRDASCHWNLANCHATVQKLLIRQVLTKSMVWSWRFRQCALNHDAIESASIVSSFINKPTTLSCIYHLSTDDLLWRNFLSPQCRNCSRDPDHAHLGSTYSSQD